MMSRRVQIVIAAVGALILILLVLPFLIPVNQFRPTIEEKASVALGRKVTLGNLSLSILSGSLSAEEITIAEDRSFGEAPFLTAKSLKVGVELIPLISSKRLNVTNISIDEPQVRLLRNAGGKWNFASLGSTAANSKPTPTGAVNPSSATDFSVKKIELNDGRIIVGSSPRQHSTYEHVNVSVSDFSMVSEFPVTVTADLPGGGSFSLQGKAGPIDNHDASITPLNAKLKIDALNLASTGFLDSTAGLGGILDLDAAIRSRKGDAEITGKSKLSKALLVAGGAPASQPVTVEFSTKYDLRRNAGVLNPSTLKIGDAAAKLNGTYQTGGENPVVNIKLDGQNMPAKDLASFLPALAIHLPKGASLPAGTLNTNLNVIGPTNKLVTSGNVGLFGARLAGFDLGSRMSAISSLAGLQTGKDLQIEKLTTNLRIAPEGIKTDNFLAVVPSLGNLVGGGTIDSNNKMDFKMAAVLDDPSGATGSPVSQAVGMLGKLTGGGSGCKSGATVPFLIQGTTSDPKFVPDVGGLAAGMLKSQLACAGGSGTTPKQQEQAPNPLRSLTGFFGKKN